MGADVQNVFKTGNVSAAAEADAVTLLLTVSIEKKGLLGAETDAILVHGGKLLCGQKLVYIYVSASGSKDGGPFRKHEI